MNKILAFSIKNNVSFLELCEYALNAANDSTSSNKTTETPKITKIEPSKLVATTEGPQVELVSEASKIIIPDNHINNIQVFPDTPQRIM